MNELAQWVLHTECCVPPPKFICSNPNPLWDGIWRSGLWEGSWGWSPQEWGYCLYKRDKESFLTTSTMWGFSKKTRRILDSPEGQRRSEAIRNEDERENFFQILSNSPQEYCEILYFRWAVRFQTHECVEHRGEVGTQTLTRHHLGIINSTQRSKEPRR